MKPTKVILCLVLVFSTLLTFCACQETGRSGNDGTGDKETEQGPPEGSTGNSTEESTETPKEQLSLSVIADGKSDFVIVHSKFADDDTVAQARNLQSKIKRYFGVELQLSNDSETFAHEILVGNTNRSESKAAKEGLRAKDYVIQTCKDRIVIMGGEGATNKTAVTYFLDKVVYAQGRVNSTGRPMTMETKLDRLYRYNYPVSVDFRLGGLPIWDYSIAYDPDSIYSEHNAYRLRELILERTGFSLSYYKDTDNNRENEILVGMTSRTPLTVDKNAFTVQVENGKVYIAYSRMHGESASYSFIADEILKRDAEAVPAGYKVTKQFSEVLTGGEELVLGNAGDIRLMVNNLQSSGANQALRMEMLYQFYLEYMPDAIGFQEAGTNKDAEGSMQKLMQAGGVYREVPTNADGNPVNFTPIFYNPATLELLEHGWELYNFSDPNYPEAYNNGNSKSFSWARFRVKSSGKTFIFFSTHLYYKGPEQGGDVAREHNVAQLTARCNQLKAEYNCPIFGGGDMNFTVSSQAYKNMMTNGFVNARFEAEKPDVHIGSCSKESELNTEYGSFIEVPSVSSSIEGEIDIIFGYGSGYKFLTQNIMTDLYALYGSDHCPCMTDIKLN